MLYIAEGFAHGLFYLVIVEFFGRYIVERYLQVQLFCLAFLFEGNSIEAVGFSHQTTQTITLIGSLEEGFGCPDENLCVRILTTHN